MDLFKVILLTSFNDRRSVIIFWTSRLCMLANIEQLLDHFRRWSWGEKTSPSGSCLCWCWCCWNWEISKDRPQRHALSCLPYTFVYFTGASKFWHFVWVAVIIAKIVWLKLQCVLNSHIWVVVHNIFETSDIFYRTWICPMLSLLSHWRHFMCKCYDFGLDKSCRPKSMIIVPVESLSVFLYRFCWVQLQHIYFFRYFTIELIFHRTDVEN